MKSIMFKTKIFHEGKMYLLVSDVTKMMEISEKAFCKKYSDKIVEIPGCRKCIAETDFNLLISDDKELFKKMGMLEVTKVETLRSEIASIISFQPLKFMMAKEYLNMMKIKTGCKSEQQYVEKYEIAKEFDEALQRFMNSHHDNSLRTLVHLKNSPTGVNIILFSDNVGNNKLHNIEYTDFRKEYPTVKLSMKKTGGIFHDRFIVLDYGTADERVFLCGASSKDAGARITSIVEDYGTAKYNSVIAGLLKNSPLVLPK